MEKSLENLKLENEKLTRDLIEKDKALYELSDFLHNIRCYNLNNDYILDKLSIISINLRNSYTKGGIMNNTDYKDLVVTNQKLVDFAKEIWDTDPSAKNYFKEEIYTNKEKELNDWRNKSKFNNLIFSLFSNSSDLTKLYVCLTFKIPRKFLL